MALSDIERAVLDFERNWVLETGSKDVAIRVQLGLSPSAFYKLRRALIESPEARDYEPLVVRRLLRDGEHRRRAKFEGRSAGQPPR
jgi:hypothetical protein